jgi:hypothetical protein
MRKTYTWMGIAMAAACCGCNAGNISNIEAGGHAASSARSERPTAAPGAEATKGARGEQGRDPTALEEGARSGGLIRDTAVPERGAGSVPLTRLDGSGIRSRLVGRRITPDRRASQANLEFTEDFLPNGTWAANRAERRIMVERGTWRIVEDQICVTVTDRQPSVTVTRRPTRCRRVWTDPTGRIAMRDMGSARDVIIIMSASPIR